MYSDERTTLFIDGRWPAPATGDVIEAVGVKASAKHRHRRFALHGRALASGLVGAQACVLSPRLAIYCPPSTRASA